MHHFPRVIVSFWTFCFVSDKIFHWLYLLIIVLLSSLCIATALFWTQTIGIRQCHVAAMVAASASVSYSSVNQYDGNNRSIMWRHLNSCSSCDSSSNSSSFRRHNSMRNCRHHQHYHHTRRPAIRQNKRCTFATTATILSTSPTSSTTTTCIRSSSANNLNLNNNSILRHNPSSSVTLIQTRQADHQNPHQICQSQSSNSSNASSIRMID